MRKKMLHIISSSTWRGAEQQVDYMFNNKNAAADIYLFCVEKSMLATKNKTQSDRIFTYKKRFGFDIFAALELKNVCRKLAIDLIHLHDSHAMNTFFLADLFALNTPAVIHRHVNFPIKNKWKYQHKKIKKIICVSNAVKKNLSSFVDENKLVVIHPGIDINWFQNPDFRIKNLLKYELKLPNETKLIGMVAAIEPEKNIDTFIEIANRFTERKDVKFVLVGDGSLKSKYAAGNKHIYFLGFRNDIAAILSSLDVFLFTSKNEGFGQVLLEAMAAQVPIVSSNFPAAHEIIEHEKTGFIYKDVDNAVSIIDKLLTTHDLRLTTITNAFNIVQQFDISLMNKKILNTYNLILTTTK